MIGDTDDAWASPYGPSWVDRIIAAQPDVLDEIDAWWRDTSPVPMVGSRHHTVPRFYLERFAAAGRLWVRDRVTGLGRTEAVTRTGVIRDFYTFINVDGEKDGRLERILAEVEGAAKEVFDRLLSPLHRPQPLEANESMRVALFIAFQLLRTPRHRREIELMGDYVIRTQHRHIPGIGQVRAVPEPNLHLELMTKTVYRLSDVFYGRPTTLVTIDQPLFITATSPSSWSPAGTAATSATCRPAARPHDSAARTRGNRAATAAATPTHSTSTPHARAPPKQPR